MEKFINGFVTLIARAHTQILTLNDSSDLAGFDDKQLHFIVIAVLGMAMFFVIYPLFKALSHNHVMTIAFIYVLTLIIGLTFAIEIGQKISGTGTMEFGDIVFGITGFILAYAIFAVIWEILIAIKNGISDLFKK